MTWATRSGLGSCTAHRASYARLVADVYGRLSADGRKESGAADARSPDGIGRVDQGGAWNLPDVPYDNRHPRSIPTSTSAQQRIDAIVISSNSHLRSASGAAYELNELCVRCQLQVREPPPSNAPSTPWTSQLREQIWTRQGAA